MKNYKQPLLTIFVIFATAYILSMMGCSSSSSGTDNPPQKNKANTDEIPEQPQESVLQPIDLNELRECTNDEFSNLIEWSTSLSNSDQAIKISSLLPKKEVIKLALEAIKKCDEVEYYHSLKPCKKTKRVITTPEKPIVTGYDAYRIKLRCKTTENYLIALNLRPKPNQNLQPQPEIPVQPAPVNPTPNETNPERQCTTDEFSKLNSWRSAVDLATKKIAKLGPVSAWKYDENAIEAAKKATLSCESLINYHQKQPCQREKSYTVSYLKEQCLTARSYYYNFAQRTESLITPNADLYFDTRIIANQVYEPGPSNLSLGLCVLTNQSNSKIVYSGQKTLITEARVYTDERYKMFVFLTTEGLKFECYGVDYSSAATSLSEVKRLLAARDTKINLFYELK